jgi:aminopeptidase N
MEYPQLVMISFSGERSMDWTKSVNAHEIGHQWFYGIIGNNEYDEPWLDESFASFAAALYDGDLDTLQVEPLPDEYYHLSSQIADFTARADEGGIGAYYYTIYDFGSSTLNDLRQLVGDETFYSAMQQYFKEQKFGVSHTAEFMNAMEEGTGWDLTEFFKEHRVFLSDQE